MNAQKGTLLIIDQMSDLLQQLPQTVYSSPIPLFHGSSVGQHFRHILEFYTCLLEGSGASYINYNSRQRNDTIAASPQTALDILDRVATEVALLSVNQPVQVESDFDTLATDNPTYLSSIGRELQYAFDHAVHHLAIIRMGLETHFPEITIAADLGIAPSTIRFREAEGVVLSSGF